MGRFAPLVLFSSCFCSCSSSSFLQLPEQQFLYDMQVQLLDRLMTLPNKIKTTITCLIYFEQYFILTYFFNVKNVNL